MASILSARQESILAKVVERHRRTGQPVSSRELAADREVDCGPSTVRNELALLEERGLLAHPHTSAGRVPTEAGQRYVVDRMLLTGEGLARTGTLELSLFRSEVEEAMRETTETLSQVTNLLAVVSAPSLSSATVRHIEVLELQPGVLMVVIINSRGGVSKMLFTLDGPADPGLVAWAREYLNERLAGLALGARMLQQRLWDPSLGPVESAFLDHLAPAFGAVSEESGDVLYVEGAARLLSSGQSNEVAQIDQLMNVLERRVALLRVLRVALAEPGVYVRIGRENELPALRSLALVAAGYGVSARKLGAVSVIGPVRMDYPSVISAVREAAGELSRFIEATYVEG